MINGATQLARELLNPVIPQWGRADSLVGFTYLSGGECLLCQFSIEVLFLFSYVLFVAARVDERVRASVFQARILFL